MIWQRTVRWAVVVLVTLTTSAWAREWVADFTSTAPESWTGSDATAVANYADTGGGNPNSYTITYDGAGGLPAGWLIQGTRGGTATTAKFFNAPVGGSGRARFATPLPTTMDANGGISVGWNARYGGYVMGRAPVQIAVYDDGTSGGTPYTAYFQVQNGTQLAILDNGGGAYGNIEPLAISNVADGLYHQWSCAVMTSGGEAHWKLWLDGTQLLFAGTDGAHMFDPGGGAEQFSFKTSTNGFTPITGPSGAYIGLGELDSIDQWDFEFDCVSFKDDGLAELSCGTTPACDSGVTPVGAQASTAMQNGAATPPSVAYTFLSAGTGPVSYTVAETDAGGTPQGHAWLSLNKLDGGPVPPGGSEEVIASIIDTSMAPGTYTAYVTFTDDCSPANQHIRQIDLAITSAGAIRIDPNDDVTLRGSTNYNATPPFGLFVKNAGDVSYVEFTLGVAPVTEAKLVLHNDDTGVSNPWEIVVKGEQFDFDETTFTGTSTAAWPQVGTIPDVMAVAFYQMDLTTWYNANVGKTMTLFLTRDTQPSGSGPIFEDREGTKTGDAATFGPRLEVVEGSLPDCKSVVNPEGTATATAFRNLPASPSSFQYDVVNAGANPLSYTVATTDAGGTPQEYAWLSLNKSGGEAIPSLGSDTFIATIIDTDLPDGTYTAFIGITDDCTPAVTHIREIELTVIDCRSAVSPAGNTGRAFLLGSAQTPDPVSYTFENTAVADVGYTVTTAGDCGWLQLDKTSGEPIGPGGSDTVTGTIDPTGLPAGGHVCTLTFTDDCDPAVQHSRDVLLSIDEAITGPPSGLQQFDAEFTTFTGSDLSAQSPLESCDPNVTTDREFSVQGLDGSLPPGWLTQGSISGTPTTAKFDNPPDGNTGRARFKSFLPFDSTLDPAKGMIVAWSMRVGSSDVIVRGPIQITFPRVTGPFGTDGSISPIAGDMFNCYIRLQNGTDVRILNNGGGAIGTIDELTLDTWIADEYHQWTAAVCYNAADQMAYWNLWLDGEKLLFGGGDGTVVGPGGDVFSFRTGLNDVTGDPYIGLGELGSAAEDVWDFEFDWVRMLTLNVAGCPFWDGEGCVPEPLCPTPFADADEDGDVDQSDFGDFQRCFTGTGNTGAFDPDACACYDRDGDDDVDILDGQKFEACASGPDVPWQPSAECP